MRMAYSRGIQTSLIPQVEGSRTLSFLVFYDEGNMMPCAH